jgi:hypothetical protein
MKAVSKAKIDSTIIIPNCYTFMPTLIACGCFVLDSPTRRLVTIQTHNIENIHLNLTAMKTAVHGVGIPLHRPEYFADTLSFPAGNTA